MKIRFTIAVVLLVGLTAVAANAEDAPQRYSAGTYQVGNDILPGIYAGRAGTDLLGTCYWERLKGVSGQFSDIIANDNAVGQFYIEVLSTDRFLKIGCDVTALSDWPAPLSQLSELGPGTYIVGRDISSGTFRGKAGTDFMDSCYWARLKGVSGQFSDIIANDNATGQYFVQVAATDYAFHSKCALERISE